MPVFDAGSDGEQYYIASAFIEGHTLADVIEEERPDFHRAATIVRSLAEAVAFTPDGERVASAGADGTVRL